MDLKEGLAPARQMLLEAPIVGIEELQVLLAREERKRQGAFVAAFGCFFSR